MWVASDEGCGKCVLIIELSTQKTPFVGPSDCTVRCVGSRGGGAARRTSSPSRFYLKPLCHLGCVLVKHAPQNAQSTNATERPGCVTTRVQGPPSAKTAAQ